MVNSLCPLHLIDETLLRPDLTSFLQEAVRGEKDEDASIDKLSCTIDFLAQADEHLLFLSSQFVAREAELSTITVLAHNLNLNLPLINHVLVDQLDRELDLQLGTHVKIFIV